MAPFLLAWLILELPCLVWFVRWWYKTNPNVNDGLVFFVSIPLAVPICIVILFFGTIFNILDWANNGSK